MKNFWLWLDLEMTGLNVEHDIILEMAAILTDDHLNIIAEQDSIVLKATEDELESMSAFVHDLHQRSGLLDAVKKSSTSLHEAEKKMLAFIDAHHPEGTALILAGNSIATDRHFIKKYCHALDQRLHYRQIDVTTVKLLATSWYPELPPFEKTNTHRALDDIRESVAELDYYRQHLGLTTES